MHRLMLTSADPPNTQPAIGGRSGMVALCSWLNQWCPHATRLPCCSFCLALLAGTHSPEIWHAPCLGGAITRTTSRASCNLLNQPCPHAARLPALTHRVFEASSLLHKSHNQGLVQPAQSATHCLHHSYYQPTYPSPSCSMHGSTHHGRIFRSFDNSIHGKSWREVKVCSQLHTSLLFSENLSP